MNDNKTHHKHRNESQRKQFIRHEQWPRITKTSLTNKKETQQRNPLQRWNISVCFVFSAMLLTKNFISTIGQQPQRKATKEKFTDIFFFFFNFFFKLILRFWKFWKKNLRNFSILTKENACNCPAYKWIQFESERVEQTSANPFYKIY